MMSPQRTQCLTTTCNDIIEDRGSQHKSLGNHLFHRNQFQRNDDGRRRLLKRVKAFCRRVGDLIRAAFQFTFSYLPCETRPSLSNSSLKINNQDISMNNRFSESEDSSRRPGSVKPVKMNHFRLRTIAGSDVTVPAPFSLLTS